VLPDSDAFRFDKLGRRPDAELLTALLAADARPSVISIDAPWGGGKSTFVQMWSEYLREKGHPVVVYNAWENDYVDDPLIAFIGEIEEDVAAIRESSVDNPRLHKQWLRLRSLAGGVLRQTAPLAIRIASQGLLDITSVKDALGFVSNSDEEIGEHIAKLTEERLVAYHNEKTAIESFRNTLQTIAGELTSKTSAQAPLIVFVDELDRCRPSFAVALLERMKHLFAVPGVAFVLALDREQLAHTIRAIYGEGFDANGYLRRFIDFDYRLPRPTGKAFSEFLAEKFEVESIFSGNEASRGEYSGFVSNFAELSAIFSLSLRDQEQAFQRLVLALRAAESPRHYLYSPLLVLMGLLRVAESILYHRFLNGDASIRELTDAIRQRAGGQEFLVSHRGTVCLAYLISGRQPDSLEDEFVKSILAARQDRTAPDDERERAAHLGAILDSLRNAGGRGAWTAALIRLEKISSQVRNANYD
jgi:hypothetical protein